MAIGEPRPGYELWRPNREKASSRQMQAIVIALMLATAGICLVVAAGGWARLEGGGAIVISYVGLYLLFAYLVSRWRRGVLPVASALSIVLLIFALIAAPAWFARDKAGFDSPILPEPLLGILTLLIVPISILTIVAAMIGFNQEWHVEEERPVGSGPRNHGATA